jgi:hypothetical protein
MPEPREERYHEYILRKTKEWSKRESDTVRGDSDGESLAYRYDMDKEWIDWK